MWPILSGSAALYNTAITIMTAYSASSSVTPMITPRCDRAYVCSLLHSVSQNVLCFLGTGAYLFIYFSIVKWETGFARLPHILLHTDISWSTKIALLPHTVPCTTQLTTVSIVGLTAAPHCTVYDIAYNCIHRRVNRCPTLYRVRHSLQLYPS